MRTKQFLQVRFFFICSWQSMQIKRLIEHNFFFVTKRRCRKIEHNNSPYELVPATLNTYSDSITADLVNKNNGHLFVLKVEGVQVSEFKWILSLIFFIILSFSSAWAMFYINIFVYLCLIGRCFPRNNRWENTTAEKIPCHWCFEGASQTRCVCISILKFYLHSK